MTLHPVPQLTPARKSVYALGDFTVNTALSTLNLIYAAYFLTQVAGLRPALAGLVPLIGRFLDAFTDPLMGRISDQTTWQAGRRRPYFLLGAIPFGLSFAMLWTDPPFSNEIARFGYYTATYCVLTTAMTVLSVPYLSLLPEMALGYDERTSLNAYRNFGSLMGIFAAISIRPLANLFGGGFGGFASAGIAFGVMLTLPWVAVYAVSFERPRFAHRPHHSTFRAAMGSLLHHGSFLRLTGLYLAGRIAMDVVGTMLILYFTFWIQRSEDFEIAMMLFLITVALSLPLWLRFSIGRDKASIFLIGTLWWMGTSVMFYFAQPDWPRWTLMLIPPLAGLGYAVVDLMPWAMLGDVIDEDDLRHGERREGLYNGAFTFIRKLGGATGVFLVMGILELAGFTQGESQDESVRQTIRILTVLGPVTFLAIAAWLTRGYPLTRAAHAGIVAQLAEREQQRRTETPRSG